jgi:hypothetical protein
VKSNIHQSIPRHSMARAYRSIQKLVKRSDSTYPLPQLKLLKKKYVETSIYRQTTFTYTTEKRKAILITEEA